MPKVQIELTDELHNILKTLAEGSRAFTKTLFTDLFKRVCKNK